jgi:hypothetical protein
LERERKNQKKRIRKKMQIREKRNKYEGKEEIQI